MTPGPSPDRIPILFDVDRVQRTRSGHVTGDLIMAAGEVGQEREFGRWPLQIDSIRDIQALARHLVALTATDQVPWERLIGTTCQVGLKRLEAEEARELAVDVSYGPEPGPREFDIDGLEERGSVNGYYGTEGILKTFQAIRRALGIVSGRDYLGYRCRQGPVVFWDFEMSREEFTRRAWLVARGMGLEGPPRGLFYRRMRRPLLDSLDEMAADIKETGAISGTVDSLSFAGVVDMETAIAAIAGLSSLGVTVAVYDHQARVQRLEQYGDKLPYGSRFKEGGFNSLWQMELADDQPPHGVDVLFRDMKFRSGPRRQDIGCRVLFFADRVTFEVIDPAASAGLLAKMPQVERVYYAVLALGAPTADEVAEETGIAKATVKSALSRLKRQGRLEDRPGESKNEPHRWALQQPTATPEEGVSEGVAVLYAATLQHPPLTDEPATPATPLQHLSATPVRQGHNGDGKANVFELAATSKPPWTSVLLDFSRAKPSKFNVTPTDYWRAKRRGSSGG
jgi:hypothetical protein